MTHPYIYERGISLFFILCYAVILLTFGTDLSQAYADDKADPTGGLKWNAQHPVGKGKDDAKIQDLHAQSPKDGGTVDVDRIVKGDKKKTEGKTKETDKKTTDKKEAAKTEPKGKDIKAAKGKDEAKTGRQPEIDSLADELTPPSIRLFTGLPPKQQPTGILPPHSPRLGDGPSADMFGTTMAIGKYEEIAGRLWRDFNDGKISEEEYKRKMEMLRELERQWKKWNDLYWKNFMKTGVNEDNRQEMKDYRERIDKRMDEIYWWKPEPKPKEKKPKEKKTDKPIAMETGDATGIFQTVDTIGVAASPGDPVDSRSMHLETQDISERVRKREREHYH